MCLTFSSVKHNLDKIIKECFVSLFVFVVIVFTGWRYRSINVKSQTEFQNLSNYLFLSSHLAEADSIVCEYAGFFMFRYRDKKLSFISWSITLMIKIFVGLQWCNCKKKKKKGTIFDIWACVQVSCWLAFLWRGGVGVIGVTGMWDLGHLCSGQ